MSAAETPNEGRTCGTCQLWGSNFYPPSLSRPGDTTCCADAAMNLPASFIPERQTMRVDQGEGCICWQPIELPNPTPDPTNQGTGNG